MYSKIKVGSNKYLKRFCGVLKKTFNLIVKVLDSIYKNLYKHEGNPSKSSIKDKLIMTLIYLRTYSTYFHIVFCIIIQNHKLINDIQQFILLKN